MGSIYFLSDVHLAVHENELETRKRTNLLQFLEGIDGKAESLYILGDLFDFWFEWYHVIPKYWFPVLSALKTLNDHGVKVYLLPGNHDFVTSEYLERNIGIRQLPESHEFVAGGKRFYLAHGDGLAKRDRGYRLLKRIIRSRASIFLFRTFISADLGVQLAKWISRSSRELRQIDRSAWNEEYFDFARSLFSEGIDYVLLGHLHQPLEREENGRKYINCGDWLREYSYARFDGKDLRLYAWEGAPESG
jgi:UDP-2,3-diacylglucosamine hydrolase